VKAPDFSLPDIEQDIVVFAILTKKSEPRQRKPANGNGKKKDDDGKYMVTSLTDLDYELDMFLFDSGFKRFYKLSEGTVVAILNPSIMPPPPGKQDTGRFSLVINSDDDTILEVGMARDLGFCQSIKKDGNSCGSWVNKKKTQFCEFHSNEAVRKQQSIRVEMNTSGFGQRDSQDRRRNWRERWTSPKKRDDNENYNYNKKNNNYDWESRTQWFMSRSMSAADLIDGKDLTSGDRKERAEFLKRSLEAKEKEREMMRKLGRVGNAAGKEYMKYAGSSGQNDSASLAAASQASQDSHRVEGQPSVDAASLDLLRGDRAIHLSPVKRKRHDSSQASSVATSSRSTPYGWGGELKEKLSNMKSGENFLRGKKSTSPVRKKTRFVTSKGIREAGRESLGNELSQRQITLEDDDDDDLVILR
jgi:minichromosome maintenance protein 10